MSCLLSPPVSSPRILPNSLFSGFTRLDSLTSSPFRRNFAVRAQAVKLSEYIGKKITPYIDRYEEFEKLNTEVLGVSVDSVLSHLAWVQTDRKSGGLGDLNSWHCTERAFIIDKEGVIQNSTINNLGIGRSVDETMRTLHALQYVQENPEEVCPAGWKPGEKSMKPHPS